MLNSVQSWSLLLGIGFVFAMAFTFLSVVARKRRQQRQAKGLQWLSSFRELLSHIQKHRGLTSGYLNGGENLVSEIESLQRKVSSDFSMITRVDHTIEGNSRWCGLTQHWARLAGNYPSHTTAHNLSQHNMLIKNVLYLIDDLAQDCDLLLLKNSNDKPLHLYWRELLLAAEYIGQARAVGIVVSTAMHCDSISRIRLNYLCEKIEMNTQRLWQQLGDDLKQTNSIQELLDCIHRELILERPNISPADFFELATAAIDALLEQFDRLIQEQQWTQKLSV